MDQYFEKIKTNQFLFLTILVFLTAFGASIILAIVAVIQGSNNVSVVLNDDKQNVCQAEVNRNNLINQLTINGQQTYIKILLNIQNTTGVVIQPLLNITFSTNNSNFNQIMNSTDASKLIHLANLFCYNHNASWCGIGSLQNMCTYQSDINSLVALFSLDNKQAVRQMVNNFITGLKSFNSTVLTLVNYFDSVEMKYLEISENTSILNSLSLYSFIYNYL
jgi:hypothetical protein